MTACDVVSVIAKRPDSPRLILNHNLHSAYLYRENSWFRDFYAMSDLIVIDGWPIFTLAATSRTLSSDYRIGSTDWISALWASPDLDPMRVFILGGSEQVNADAISSWWKWRSTDSVAGRSGYMTVDEEQGVVDMIREHDPHLILVGMGMPLQEAFLTRNLAQMPNAYIATVGGAVDYVAGAVKLSPRWLGRLGLEWMWRLAHDPARLYGRYIVEPFKLASVIMRDRLRGRRGEGKSVLAGTTRPRVDAAIRS
jgi:N-acetylglucosaminyldiphosphoundecaprenol N-acetyl-beta-D-mannosaminyltransferase